MEQLTLTIQNGSEGTSHTSSATGEGHGSMGSAIAGAAMGYMIARTMGSFLGPSYNPSNRAVSTPTGQVIHHKLIVLSVNLY